MDVQPLDSLGWQGAGLGVSVSQPQREHREGVQGPQFPSPAHVALQQLWASSLCGCLL